MKAESPLIRTIEIKDRNGRVVGTKEVVTYQGLLSKAHDDGLRAVRTALIQTPSDENGRVAIAKAEVETGKGLFEGLGDASPENVNSFIVPHLIRMAETRAKARALRDAVNVGVASFEELDGEPLVEDSFSLGSGADRNGRSSPVGNGPSSRRSSSRSTQTATMPPDIMSEAQRRYMFRILAGQGLQGEAAHEQLKEDFGVESLAEVTKAQATEMIDRLLSRPREEVPSGGGHQR